MYKVSLGKNPTVDDISRAMNALKMSGCDTFQVVVKEKETKTNYLSSSHQRYVLPPLYPRPVSSVPFVLVEREQSRSIDLCERQCKNGSSCRNPAGPRGGPCHLHKGKPKMYGY